MATYTKTRTSANEPERTNTVVSSLAPPTRDEVIAQLKEHFSKQDKDFVSPEDILKLADHISQEFDELRDNPPSGFARYLQESPTLNISKYKNDVKRFFSERYLIDYSPLATISIQCSRIDFQLTVVSTTKSIFLSYIA